MKPPLFKKGDVLQFEVGDIRMKGTVDMHYADVNDKWWYLLLDYRKQPWDVAEDDLIFHHISISKYVSELINI